METPEVFCETGEMQESLMRIWETMFLELAKLTKVEETFEELEDAAQRLLKDLAHSVELDLRDAWAYGRGASGEGLSYPGLMHATSDGWENMRRAFEDKLFVRLAEGWWWPSEDHEEEEQEATPAR